MSLREWWRLMELPEPMGRRTHHLSMAEVHERAGAGLTFRVVRERLGGGGRRETVLPFARALLALDQPPVAREYLAAFIEGRSARPRDAPRASRAKVSDKEQGLLRLLVMHPSLLREFWGIAVDWSPTASFLRPDWLYLAYSHCGVHRPIPAQLLPRCLDHTHLCSALACELGVQVALRTSRRLAFGVWALRGALSDRFGLGGDPLGGLETQAGYAEAREFLAGAWRPGIGFFVEVESAWRQVNALWH